MKTQKNKIFDKLTKNISFEKLTRTPSPSPTNESFDTKLTSSNNLQKPHNTKQNMRSHNINDKIIPIPKLSPNLSSSNNSDSKELKNNAFEIVFDNNDKKDTDKSTQNIHPLDEPFILRNGKKIFPNSNINNDINSDSTIDINDIIKIIKNILSVIYSNLHNFWKMDLHFDLMISNDKSLKIHIPSLVFTLIGGKLLFTIFKSSDPETINVLRSQPATNNSSIFPLIIVFGFFCYCYFNYSTTSTTISTEEIPEPKVKKFNTSAKSLNSSISSTETNNIWDSESNNEYESDVTPPLTRKNSTPISLTRKNSLTNKLETLINKNKPPVSKNYHPVHRYEERKRSNTGKLNLNLPQEYKRNHSPTRQGQMKHPNNSFEELSRKRREEMLKGFNT